MTLRRKHATSCSSVASWNVCDSPSVHKLGFVSFLAYFCKCWSWSYRLDLLSQTSPFLYLHSTVNQFNLKLSLASSAQQWVCIHETLLKYIFLLSLYALQIHYKTMKRLYFERSWLLLYILCSQLPQSREKKWQCTCMDLGFVTDKVH